MSKATYSSVQLPLKIPFWGCNPILGMILPRNAVFGGHPMTHRQCPVPCPIYGCLPSVCPPWSRLLQTQNERENFEVGSETWMFFLLDIPKNRFFFSDSAVSFFLNDSSGIYLPFVIIYAAFFTPNKLSFSFWRWQETMGLFQFRICFCLWFSSRCSSLRAHVTRLCHNLRTAGRGTKRSCVPVPGLWCHIV